MASQDKDPREAGIKGLFRALRQITGSEEATYRAAGAVVGWIAYEAEIAAREGRPDDAIEDLGRRLDAAID